MELLTGLYSKDRLLQFPTNIRLGQNLLTMANTLAYLNTKLFMGAKIFVVQVAGALTVKF